MRSRHVRGHSRRPRNRGQALVEFALMLPVLLLLTLGIVDFGRIFFSQIALANAVREGAMYAAEGDRTVKADYLAHILSRMQPEADAAGITLTGVTIKCTLSANAVGVDWDGLPNECTSGIKPTFIQVRASTQVNLITPFLPAIPMTARTTTASIGPAPSPAPTPTPTPTPAPTPTPTPTPTPKP